MSFFRSLISYFSGLDKISDSAILCELQERRTHPDISYMTSEEVHQATQDAIEHLNQMTEGNK